MIPNILVLAGAALIPFFVAYAWFHPSLFGGENWTSITGMSVEHQNKKVKPLKLLLTILLNFFIAFGLYNLSVHQSGVFSLLGGDIELMKTGTSAAFLAEYGDNYLSFGHGAIHGFFATVVFALPILGYVTIFEFKSRKYFLVYLGYWLVSFVLMAGVICQWGATNVMN